MSNCAPCTSKPKRPVYERLFALVLAACLVVSLAGLFLVCVGVRPAYADDPKGYLSPDLISSTITNRAICLSASDDGPYFTLSDLAAYVPKPRKWVVKPTVWKEYPDLLKSVPLVSRTYATETVSYLAQHEIRCGDRSSSYVALTFDCEIGTYSTQHILATLREGKVKATFFLQGKYVYLNPEIVREIHTDGHELGSHSFFHPRFTDLSPITSTQEVTYTEAALAWAVGGYVPMRYFRFPYGGRNDDTRKLVATLGYQSAFWDLDPRGWEPGVGAEDVVDYIRRTAHGGGIVIMHCGCWDDANALPGVIQAIREKGLTPGTLSDVLTEEDRTVPGYDAPP